MRKPTEPRRPKFKDPKEFFTTDISKPFVLPRGKYKVSALESLIKDKLGSTEKAVINVDSWGIKVFGPKKIQKIPNPKYREEVNKYQESLLKYEEKVEKYKQNLIKFSEWEEGQKKLKIEKEISTARAVLKKHGISAV